MYNYFYKFLPIWILMALLLRPALSCQASVNPPASKSSQKKKAIRTKTRLSFKQPYYYHKKPLDCRQPKKAPNKIVCEGPDLGEMIGGILLILLAWAIPTGILVLLGLLLGISWLWILGLVLFLIPVFFVIIILVGVAFA